ncbi:MAG: ribosome small subunit-dependent GTPase A [Candidatus Latescibacteria bacterium]|nr:ribosome small subunit-dependent GTPase A [Candidatus Latescibacterota bacterium]NIM66439.1 ribosome small subunit-dependent GTPase A [Candidatus Latescibacterota bacterium]NIO02919.1 ribosome small subunit-dependent GTPase A [Candidatus Latescibacterota bacterium]NIO30054.1 ribosome small subunit-dependent GTPase A [Candidatus Latescibacterota bacterium]NIO57669.1 ribosome small subunit-dependent GTPase A [Candidatus Latescibacterota bacterium]
MPKSKREGRVIRVTGGDVWVEVEDRLLSCVLRGRFRQRGRGVQIAAGDRVLVSTAGPDSDVGAIEEVLPRESSLSRFIEGRDSGEKLIVANIDMLFAVTTLRAPSVNYNFIDRVLVSAEWGEANACVCLNKIDLVEDRSEIERLAAIYTSCGYRTIRTSAKTGEGVDELEKMLQGGIYAFVGESGVGKSSLLMKMDQELDLKVRSLGEKSKKGRHTTAYSQLFPIRGGYMADTPGIQTFGFPGTELESISNCFPEFRDMESDCHFHRCTHSHEPDCAVKAALEQGRVHRSRYDSYLSILSEVEARIKKKAY